jgi:hypothetical protein
MENATSWSREWSVSHARELVNAVEISSGVRAPRICRRSLCRRTLSRLM